MSAQSNPRKATFMQILTWIMPPGVPDESYGGGGGESAGAGGSGSQC